MREETCCFTGHRDIPAQEVRRIMERTETYIWELMCKGVKYFGVGGALGYDTQVAQLLFRLRTTEAFRHIKVILVYPFCGFTRQWTLEQQALYNALFPLYDKTVCVSSVPSREAYLKRNRHLVDSSGYCIAYCTKSAGGTAYTVSYARAQGLHIKNTGG